ncbi:MAG: response regulator [Elusimicrobia bacterium]|nr:response regulator [Elusimicrobiota bacterium]
MLNKMKKTYTTFGISRICGVYPTTVANWIDKGILKAFATPGGHRRVREEDLKKFLKIHKIPIPDDISLPTKKRILVVDDDQSVRNAIEGIIKTQKKKYEVFTASDGFEAGLAVEIKKPHLVILDLFLPGIDGFGICRIIKKHNKKIKILAVTGYDTPETKKEILKAGADDYMGKPFGSKELLEKVRELFSEKS